MYIHTHTHTHVLGFHNWVCMVQWTLEQHGFELCKSTYMWIFFNSKYNSRLNLWMRNLGY